MNPLSAFNDLPGNETQSCLSFLQVHCLTAAKRSLLTPRRIFYHTLPSWPRSLGICLLLRLTAFSFFLSFARSWTTYRLPTSWLYVGERTQGALVITNR